MLYIAVRGVVLLLRFGPFVVNCFGFACCLVVAVAVLLRVGVLFWAVVPVGWR